jgi:hypothetical protein
LLRKPELRSRYQTIQKRFRPTLHAYIWSFERLPTGNCLLVILQTSKLSQLNIKNYVTCTKTYSGMYNDKCHPKFEIILQNDNYVIELSKINANAVSDERRHLDLPFTNCYRLPLANVWQTFFVKRSLKWNRCPNVTRRFAT